MMNLPVLARTTFLALSMMLISCARPAYQARGHGSYIAEQYAGRMTSSGYPYNPNDYTAAHNTLPFGTQVKVKNNYNGRTVKVVINDRFPYYPNRVINLSRVAAQELQIPYRQLADVTVTAKKIAGGQQQQQPQPQQSYGAPTQAPAGYGAPPPTYNAPPPGYGAPPPSTYGAPPAGYGTTAPPSGLGAPPPGYPGAR